MEGTEDIKEHNLIRLFKKLSSNTQKAINREYKKESSKVDNIPELFIRAAATKDIKRYLKRAKHNQSEVRN